jgi:hypothetical protein
MTAISQPKQLLCTGRSYHGAIIWTIATCEQHLVLVTGAVNGRAVGLYECLDLAEAKALIDAAQLLNPPVHEVGGARAEMFGLGSMLKEYNAFSQSSELFRLKWTNISSS